MKRRNFLKIAILAPFSGLLNNLELVTKPVKATIATPYAHLTIFQLMKKNRKNDGLKSFIECLSEENEIVKDAPWNDE